MSTVKLKRSAVSGKIPLTTDLQLGEIAINTYDGKLYLKKDDGVESIVDVTAPTLDTVTGAGASTTNALTIGDLTVNGDITVTGTVDGRDVAADGAKLDGIETGADVTDATNVAAAGALMDSELTSEASVKALNQGVATTDSPTFADLDLSDTTPRIRLSDTDGTNTYGEIQQVAGGLYLTARNGTNIGPVVFRGYDGTSLVEYGRFTPQGYLGIGTSSPVQKLQIEDGNLSVRNDTAGAHVYTTSSTTGTAGVWFGDTDAYNSGSIQYAHSSDLLSVISSNAIRLNTSGSERLRITSGGNVGIGTSNPSATLDVVGTTELNGALWLNDAFNYNGASTFYIRSRLNGGSVLIGTQSTGGTLYYPITISGTSDYTVFATQAGEAMRLNATGLGIGTSSPGRALHVKSSNANVARIESTYANLSRLWLVNPAAAEGQVGIGASSAELTMYAGGSESLRITSGGNVGIGTSNPSTPLHVNGDTTLGGGVTETVYALSGTTPALDPSNGTVQTWTLTGNSAPTDSLSAGEAITLMVDDGTAYTITWPTVTWVNNGGSAPTLATTGYTVIALWKVSTTLYGALVGDGS